MSIGTQAGADWRVLMSAALIGSGVGLSLGAAYLAGGMAQHAADHNRVQQIARAAAGGYSEAALRQETAELSPAVMRLARAHDPFAPAAQRQAAQLELEDARESAARKRARELECLTQAVYYEARGEGVRGQQAVAQVVMNRVRHRAFPKTVCGVVFQGAGRKGCQFSFACDGSMRRGREASAWKRARRIAQRALSGAVLGEVGQATHFHTTAVSPAWGPQMRKVAQVGTHVFYKFGPRKPAQAQPQSAPAQVQHAVMTAATAGGAPELRLTSAVAEKPVEVIGPPAEAPAAEAKAPKAQAAKPAQPSLTPAVSVVKPAESAALTPASDSSAGS